MKAERLFQILGLVDESLIEEAVSASSPAAVQRRHLRKISDAFFRLRRLLVDIMSVDEHTSLRCRKAPGYDVHGRGFTCAVWTKKAVDLSLFHTEREMIYGNMVTIFFCKIAYFYHICLPDMV